MCDFCGELFKPGQKLWTHFTKPFVLEGLAYNADTKEKLLTIEYVDDDGGEWAACKACHELIDQEKFSEVVDRAVRTELAKHPRENEFSVRQWILPLQRQFWIGKTGRVTEELVT
jgi:hypothetical protein